MRVHVSQSVELEDVPKQVIKMLKERANLEQLCCYIIEVLQSNVTLYKVGFCVEKIAEIRDKLVDLDFALQDCSSVLAGYVEVLKKQELAEQETPEVVEQVDDGAIVEGEDG